MIERLMRWFGYAPIAYGGPNVLVLMPEDVLVVKYSGHISAESAASLKDKFSGKFGCREVIVLSDGLELGVVRSVA